MAVFINTFVFLVKNITGMESLQTYLQSAFGAAFRIKEK